MSAWIETDAPPRAGASLPWRTGVALVAIVLICIGLRIAWIAYVNVHPFHGKLDDTVFYLASGRSLADTLEYRDNFGRLSAHWPPGYSITIAPALALFDGAIAAAKGVNVAAAAITCLLTFHLGRRAFDGRIGLLAALLVALFPGHIYFSTLIMTETVFGAVFLLILALLSTYTLERDARMPVLIAIGALAGFAALIRAEMLLFVFTVPLLWKIALPGWRRPLRNAAIFGVGLVLALTPWTVRNAIHFQEFIPIRTNAGNALASAIDPGYRTRVGGITGQAPELRDQISYMARHPWELAPMQLDKLIDLYGNDGDGIDWVMHDVAPISDDVAERWVALANAYYFYVLALALAAAPLWLRRAPPSRLVLAYGLLGWSAIELIFWPEARYHFPVIPLLCVFAAAALSWAWRKTFTDAAGRLSVG